MDSMYIAKLKDSNFATHGTRFHQDCVGLDVTQQNHFFEFVLGAYDSTLSVLVSLQGESVSCPFPPFFSSLALLNITVNPSADAGSLTSHSPNLGKGRPASSDMDCGEPDPASTNSGEGLLFLLLPASGRRAEGEETGMRGARSSSGSGGEERRGEGGSGGGRGGGRGEESKWKSR